MKNTEKVNFFSLKVFFSFLSSMSSNKFNQFSNLGVGIGLRSKHVDHILAKKPVVDWFEIIAENYLVDGGRERERLEKILEQYQIIIHGVSLYFGSSEKLSREHLKRLKALVRLTKTPWLADHLCWGSIDGTYTHDLLPLPYTKASVKAAADKIRYIRDTLEIPIAVENLSSYTEFKASTMTEWEFINEVVDAADCGILFDVNNVYVSSRNHGFDPKTYINAIPSERIAQVHIAGHSEYENILIDTHDKAPPSPVWKLYEYTIKKIGKTPTLLEWDSKIPSFDEVYKEASKAKRYLPL
jgi:uncharacterized protein